MKHVVYVLCVSAFQSHLSPGGALTYVRWIRCYRFRRGLLFSLRAASCEKGSTAPFLSLVTGEIEVVVFIHERAFALPALIYTKRQWYVRPATTSFQEHTDLPSPLQTTYTASAIRKAACRDFGVLLREAGEVVTRIGHLTANIVFRCYMGTITYHFRSTWRPALEML